MNILNFLLAVIGFKRELSIAVITKPMAAIVTKLEKYAEDQKTFAADASLKAKTLTEEANVSKIAAEDALNLAKKYSALTL